ncbi:hypothetical protein Salat_0856400 [Sesamum alatum]|uniref:Uncharacterized protein n=1 Tax=Sesamum alatum TaxID=300844 RepID=A0AAE1YIY6_9LAMI|nr:hypothetical protein Salat_0856400 [Sesamum alatum]
MLREGYLRRVILGLEKLGGVENGARFYGSMGSKRGQGVWSTVMNSPNTAASRLCCPRFEEGLARGRRDESWSGNRQCRTNSPTRLEMASKIGAAAALIHVS